MRVTNHCHRGRMCMFAHTKEEQMYHPLVYKTQLCRDWPKCNKHFCPFSHGLSELRNPDGLDFRCLQGPELLEKPMRLLYNKSPNFSSKSGRREDFLKVYSLCGSPSTSGSMNTDCYDTPTNTSCHTYKPRRSANATPPNLCRSASARFKQKADDPKGNGKLFPSCDSLVHSASIPNNPDILFYLEALLTVLGVNDTSLNGFESSQKMSPTSPFNDCCESGLLPFNLAESAVNSSPTTPGSVSPVISSEGAYVLDDSCFFKSYGSLRRYRDDSTHFDFDCFGSNQSIFEMNQFNRPEAQLSNLNGQSMLLSSKLSMLDNANLGQ